MAYSAQETVPVQDVPRLGAAAPPLVLQLAEPLPGQGLSVLKS